MKERFLKVNDWYYPFDSITCRINRDKSLSIFEIAGNGDAIEILTGKSAEAAIALLDELALPVPIEEEAE